MNQTNRKKLNTDDAKPMTRLTPSRMRDLAYRGRSKIQKLASLTAPKYSIEEVFASVPARPGKDPDDVEDIIRAAQDEHLAKEQDKDQQLDRECIAELFRELQESDAFREIVDPVAWQREQRKDRPLPGRLTDDTA